MSANSRRYRALGVIALACRGDVVRGGAAAGTQRGSRQVQVEPDADLSDR